MNLLVNKHARRNYELLESYEAGMVLRGAEVKTLRKKHGSLNEAYVSLRQRGLYLLGAYLPPYQPNHSHDADYDPYYERKLLVSKKELAILAREIKQKGTTIIPIRIYSKGRYIKIEIALARGKKKHDKRNTLRERTLKRENDRLKKEYRG